MTVKQVNYWPKKKPKSGDNSNSCSNCGDRTSFGDTSSPGRLTLRYCGPCYLAWVRQNPDHKAPACSKCRARKYYTGKQWACAFCKK